MDLVSTAWIPVRRADGRLDRIAPWELTQLDNPAIELAAPRPDFNAALAQLLIGLLYTTGAPADEDEWAEWLENPPSPEALQARFAPLAPFFRLDGLGPRFMQDHDAAMGGAEVDIASLLIDTSGGGTHFVKEGTIRGLCPGCAGLALLTLQLNAPSGGRGHRTSMRGGGPLTTLALFAPAARTDGAPITLWHNLWLNVPPRRATSIDAAPAEWFPWLSPTRTSESGDVVTEAEAHPALAFWATPRRIRLDFDDVISGVCDLCGMESERLVQRYRTRNLGANYLGWIHPLSPYYRVNEQAEWLPRHPQPGGIGYRHWLGLVVDGERRLSAPAAIMAALPRRLRALTRPWAPRGHTRLWAFGYDMDNMKARCWYEARMPYYAIDEPGRAVQFVALIDQLVEAAGMARSHVVGAVKQAWFDRPKDARGDFGFLDRAFWENTESAFYRLLGDLCDQPLEQNTPEMDAWRADFRQNWLVTLRREALRLFEQWAAGGTFEHEDPERIALAHNTLMGLLYGPGLKKTLGLPIADIPRKAKKGSAIA